MSTDVQSLARSIKRKGAKVVIDPNFEGQICLGIDCHAKLFFQCSFNALRCGFGVINFGRLSGDIYPQRDIGAQRIAPRELARTLIKLGQMKRAEFTNAGQNAGCTAQHQIGTPNIRPMTLDGDTAGCGNCG